MRFIEQMTGPIDALLSAGQSKQAAVIHPGMTKHQRTAWILSFTGVSNEPRVLRQAWSLSRHGWNVVVAGYNGHSPRPPEWTFLELTRDQTRQRLPYRGAFYLQRQIARPLYTLSPRGSSAARLGARLSYFGAAPWRRAFRQITAAASGGTLPKPDLLIAHDPETCPPAFAVAQRWHIPVVVDCHEYGRGQYMHDPRWVADGRHFTTALQDDFLNRADGITTVCDGIRDLLNDEQRLRRPAITIKSLPFRNIQPFRPTGDVVTVLYHGLICEDRGLEQAVQSLSLWDRRFRLVIRGNGDQAMIAGLNELAARNGVSDRLRIEPGVAFDDIIPSANAADIGLFAQPDHSAQKRLALPNKFFEYIMAGLALCVSDFPEMAAIVRKHGLGRLISTPDPAAIAASINSMTNADIDACKQASIKSAETLNWQNEEPAMLEFYERILREHSSRA